MVIKHLQEIINLYRPGVNTLGISLFLLILLLAVGLCVAVALRRQVL